MRVPSLSAKARGNWSLPGGSGHVFVQQSLGPQVSFFFRKLVRPIGRSSSAHDIALTLQVKDIVRADIFLGGAAFFDGQIEQTNVMVKERVGIAKVIGTSFGIQAI